MCQIKCFIVFIRLEYYYHPFFICALSRKSDISNDLSVANLCVFKYCPITGSAIFFNIVVGSYITESMVSYIYQNS